MSRKQIFPVFIPHLGCPFHCSFCRQDVTSGAAVPPTPQDVSRLLNRLLPEQGEGEIAFYGGSFTFLDKDLQASYLAAASDFVSAGRVAGIRFSTRPDGLDSGIIQHLKRWPITTVEIGCQSFSPFVLAQSGRGHDPESIAPAVQRLRQLKVQIGLQLMPGLPGSDRKEALDSLKQALHLNPDFLRIYPTVVIKGSRLEQDYRNGSFRPLDLESAVDLCADMLIQCYAADMPVIRLGLQTDDVTSPEAIVAGPYHQAFGQLVRSRLWLRLILNVLPGHPANVIMVHPADYSDVVGQSRVNMVTLNQRFPELVVRGMNDVPRGSLLINKTIFHLHEM